MARIEIAPRVRSRRIGFRSESGRPRLVLVPPLPSEPPVSTVSTLRLTPRGRVVVVAILVAPLLLTLSLLFRSQVDASSDPPAPRSNPMIVVQPGDTLWTIAGRVAPDRDRRAVIHQIREINGLSGASIQAGLRLAVPTS